MHFNLKRAVGVMAVPLLGSALAVGAAALPANAATWQDTSLSASAVTADTFGGSGLGVTNGTKVIDLVGTKVTWSTHGTLPAGVTLGSVGYARVAEIVDPDNFINETLKSNNDSISAPFIVRLPGNATTVPTQAPAGKLPTGEV